MLLLALGHRAIRLAEPWPAPDGPVVRGAGGHSVLGFWQAHAPRQPFHFYVREGALIADLFVLAINNFLETLDVPTLLVLDNAPIYKAHLVRACHADGAVRGLTLFFCLLTAPTLTIPNCSGTAASSTGYSPRVISSTTPCSNEPNTSYEPIRKIRKL